MKKITIISDDWYAPSLSLVMKNEGNDLAIAMKYSKNILKGTVKRVPFADRLEAARGSDLVVFENKSNHGESAMLRAEGIPVIGGSKLTDKLELDRAWSQKLATLSGMLAPEMVEVNSFDEIYNLIKERGGKWVMKQEGKLNDIKGLNFVSRMPNSEDLLDFMPILQERWIDGVKPDFVMQEKIEGHEMACGSFWNGNEFMKDKDGDELCYENWEHKSLFPGNLGESTGEQYTIIQLKKAKYSKLFMETLDRCREMLKRLDYKGYFDVNNIVNKNGAYFLEFTPRMGVPFTSGLLEIHKSSWSDFLLAMANGEQDPNFEYDPTFCIVSWLYTKPFPFVNSKKLSEAYEGQSIPTDAGEIYELISFRMNNSENIVVNFKKDFTKEDWKHVRPDGIRWHDGKVKIANPDGMVLTVTHMGDTPEEAGEAVNAIMEKIVIPKSFWRNDFSNSNYHKSKDDLTEWGYIATKEEIEQKKLQEKNEKKRVETRQKIRKTIMS